MASHISRSLIERNGPIGPGAVRFVRRDCFHRISRRPNYLSSFLIAMLNLVNSVEFYVINTKELEMQTTGQIQTVD